MKKLLNKLLITIMVVILLFNFIMIPQSQAISIGGILLKPVTSLLMVPLDITAFMLTCFIGIFSNGVIDWVSDWATDASEVVEQWATQGTQSDNQGNFQNPLATANEIAGLGFISMEDFFCGNIEMTNINIFSSQSNNNIISGVKTSVAQWYYALRNIAALGLLCVLIYTGIRILLSTVAEDKAHYKDLLMDWVKGVCLVIFIHVLMILILNVADNLVSIIRTGMGSSLQGYSSIAWVRAQLIGNWDTSQLVYLFMYGMLLRYIVYFTISYTKRFMYTLLLIVIAPIIGLVYAFGKSGKEIFERWLKEFIANAFLQPYHLVIYTVLFGLVSSIADNGQNLFAALYALIVMHFIRDAEKYYRGLFGLKDGIAGIGQADTGIQTLERVKNKTTQVIRDVAKVGISVASLAIPGASVLSATANSIQQGQGEQASNAAGNFGDIASGFRNGDNPDSPLGPDDVDPDNPLGGPRTPLIGPSSGGGASGGDLSDNDTIDVRNTIDTPVIDEVAANDVEVISNGDTGDVWETWEQHEENRANGVDDIRIRYMPNPEDENIGVDADVSTVKTSSLKADSTDTNNLKAGKVNADQLDGGSANVEDTNLDELMRNKIYQANETIGDAMDGIAGTDIFGAMARIANRDDQLTREGIENGVNMNDKNAQLGTALEAANSVINGDPNEAGGKKSSTQQTSGGRIGDGRGGNNRTNLEVNSNTKNENKIKSNVKFGDTTTHQTTQAQGISPDTIEKALKGMPLNNLSNDEIAKVAKQVSSNLGGEIDSKDIEDTIKRLTEKAESSSPVDTPKESSTKTQNIDIKIEGGTNNKSEPKIELPEGDK